MMGHRRVEQGALFCEFSLERHVPSDHLLRSIDRFVELGGVGRQLTAFYGGPGTENLVVVMPDKVAFFGSGAVVQALADMPGCWYGGALPERGYWGAHMAHDQAEGVVARIHALLRARSHA